MPRQRRVRPEPFVPTQLTTIPEGSRGLFGTNFFQLIPTTRRRVQPDNFINIIPEPQNQIFFADPIPIANPIRDQSFGAFNITHLLPEGFDHRIHRRLIIPATGEIIKRAKAKNASKIPLVNATFI